MGMVLGPAGLEVADANTQGQQKRQPQIEVAL